MDQGEIWLGTVGPRETDRVCPNPTSRGHLHKTVSAHTTMHAHIPALTQNTCMNRIAHSYGTLDNYKTLMLIDSGVSCLVVLKSCSRQYAWQHTSIISRESWANYKLLVSPYAAINASEKLNQHA